MLHCRDVMRCDGSKNLSATLAHGKTVKMYSTRCPALFTVEGITNMFRRGGLYLTVQYISLCPGGFLSLLLLVPFCLLFSTPTSHRNGITAP